MSRTELRTELMSSIAPLMDNEQAMAQVLVFVHTLTADIKAPCRYTKEELHERLQSAKADIALGKGQTIEEIVLEAGQW